MAEGDEEAGRIVRRATIARRAVMSARRATTVRRATTARDHRGMNALTRDAAMDPALRSGHAGSRSAAAPGRIGRATSVPVLSGRATSVRVPLARDLTGRVRITCARTVHAGKMAANQDRAQLGRAISSDHDQSVRASSARGPTGASSDAARPGLRLLPTRAALSPRTTS